ncbi:hypothetical protein FDT66_02925 [Polaribacter aestuariivivens]|uniref:Uncharacterized protein n=1 Tax=Polaribacter aestuariivivens TaxID=2304626 RepID=A0A5S3NB49_9FLAO|nr:hypothetical protein [Polaribacter aestuariivivens]TMM32433.1 hypothetical protein FDT66_02925 [Polaribacter aestuariivivens]
MKSKVNFEWKSNDGCKFRIIGTIDYSVGFSGVSINDFTGSVEVSGGGDCGNRKYTFGLANFNDETKNGQEILVNVNHNFRKRKRKFIFEKGKINIPEKLTSKDFLKTFNKEMSFLNKYESKSFLKEKGTVNIYC